ncbi:CPXCG motif-containing cysteine-rich protein [Reinekea sp.]|jgi:hypothetical protein|uniref:CPXCG motif-containing cysteine-rich protein n=1 Tax=Reinekea sp. TaxID=1970455 RepID=UPI002A7EF7D9|nr:CPXCG motif-containing cysteine-rich protein [Reinekea sp.]
MTLNLIEQFYHCPYCAERVSLLVDPSEDNQELIEDCEVCCRPVYFSIQVNDEGDVDLQARREDD